MRRGGFSLIEISVVLIVVSVMISGILPYISESQKTNAANDTAERMEAIENAMLTYRAANGFIPCPSNIQATLNSAAFGTADTTASCAAATNFTDTNTAAGGVPTKTLGLPDEYGFDGWGRRMVYHVAKALTTAGGYDAGAGSITVNDATGTARTSAAAYAIVSHGPNGHGAYTRAGGTARFNFGSTNASEQENCECNASATATTYDSILTQFMATPNSNPLAAYDDIVRYTLKPNLELLVGGGSVGTGSCASAAPSGWPDAIKCSDGTNNGVITFQNMNATVAQYAPAYDAPGTRSFVNFDRTTKAYFNNTGYTGYDCISQSISQLEAAGKTFNFCGGSGGAGWEDVPLTDTANFDTNCMYRYTQSGQVNYATYISPTEFRQTSFTSGSGAIGEWKILASNKAQYTWRLDGSTVFSGGPAAVTKLEKNCGGGGGTGTKGLAVSGSSTALVAATPTDIVFSSAPTNNDFGASAWTGNKTFTVPAGEGGWYVLTGYSYVTAGVTSNMVTSIVVNGTTVAWGRDLSSSTALTGQSVAAAVNLSPGDTVVLRGQSSSATTVSAAQIGIVKVSGGSGGSSSPGGFAAYHNTTQTRATGSTVLFNTEVFDELGAYNPATSTFTAPSAGTYNFSAHMRTTPANTPMVIGIYASSAGEICAQASGTINTFARPACTGTVQLTAGETVTVVAMHNNGGSTSVDVARFSGFQVK